MNPLKCTSPEKELRSQPVPQVREDGPLQLLATGYWLLASGFWLLACSLWTVVTDQP